jgi:hypothetical protein
MGAEGWNKLKTGWKKASNIMVKLKKAEGWMAESWKRAGIEGW